MTLAELLAQPLGIGAVALLGLIVGSFLNVVIARLPVMMQSQWRADCREFLTLPSETEGTETFNLVTPRSRCPQCGHEIAAWQNIPVVSYLLLKGRCRTCAKSIPLKYPLVEITSALLSGVVAWHFGYGPQLAAALVLTWSLIALTVIDLEHQLLPDAIIYPVLWLGLLLSLHPVFAGMRESIVGAALGYLSLWSVYQLFRLITGKEGMGYGDFKLLALLGAWFGWQVLPLVIVLSSLVGIVVFAVLMVVRRQDRNVPIAFGPYLAAAGWIAMIWGNDITEAYLGSFS